MTCEEQDLSIFLGEWGLRRLKAVGTKQACGQRLADFARQVRGNVLDCRYSNPCTGCECKTPHVNDYTDRVVEDILLADIFDGDI